MEKFKARLVAKRSSHKEGIDYVDTYSLITKFISIRLILAIVAHFSLELYQIDVKTTFLNSELKDHLYATNKRIHN